nr:AfsR/SARP family transcriptional regulator [Rubrobacter sp.]
MEIGVLGPLSVDGGAVRLGSRDRIVLAALAMRSGEVLSADQLADAVWHDRQPPSWNKNLQGCVVRLRKALGQDAIETSPQGYRLAVQAHVVDGQRFQRLVGRGRELLTLGESERAMYTLGQALALWRGRPLVELEEWEPGAIEAGRLEELRLEAQELRLEAALHAGRHREVLAEAKVMATEAPLREQRWAFLALAEYRVGRQGDALRTVRQVRRMLVQEQGLDPGPDIVSLEQAILRQDTSLLVDVASPELSTVCPYRGLTPYDVDDAEGFFGRGADVAACLERLGQQGVLAVVGPSGIGK